MAVLTWSRCSETSDGQTCLSNKHWSSASNSGDSTTRNSVRMPPSSCSKRCP